MFEGERNKAATRLYELLVQDTILKRANSFSLLGKGDSKDQNVTI